MGVRLARFLVLPVYGAMSVTSDEDAPCTLYAGGGSTLLAGADLEKGHGMCEMKKKGLPKWGLMGRNETVDAERDQVVC